MTPEPRNWWKAVFVFGGIWSIASYALHADDFFLAAPHQVAQAIWSELFQRTGLSNLAYTLGRTALSVSLGVVVGSLLGAVLALSRRLRPILEPAVDFCRAVPVIAMYPLFLYFFGIGDRPIVFTAAWAASFILAVNVYYGLRNRARERQFLLEVYDAAPADHLWQDRVPGAVPQLVAGLRVAVTYAFVVVVVGEMFFPTGYSVGYALLECWELKHTARLYGYIVLLGMVGIALNMPFTFLENRVPWLRKEVDAYG